MNKAVRMLALLLTVAMVLTLAACNGTSDGKKKGSDEKQEVQGNKAPVAARDGFYMGGEGAVEIGTPAKTLDARQIYDAITYTPQMFYGRYRLLGGDEAAQSYGEAATYFTLQDDGVELELTAVPYALEAGPHSLAHSVNFIKGYNWLRASFLRKTETDIVLVTYLCAYTVEGRTLKLRPLETFSIDQDSGRIEYAFTDAVLTYEFAFAGRDLTLTAGADSLTLTAGLWPSKDMNLFHVDHYVSEGSAAANDIDHLWFRYDSTSDDEYKTSIRYTDDVYTDKAAAFLTNDGLLTIALPRDGGVKTVQYVYFYCDDDGIILTDGKNVYYYNDNYNDRNRNDLRDYITEDQTGKLDSLTDSQLEQLVEKRDDLVEELTEAFEDAGIAVTVNPQTGELAMDASVLFGGDSTELTAEGKAFLDKFLTAYTTIVMSDKYSDFVSKTLIEGHAAPVGNNTYEDSLPFSQERADTVRDYCLSVQSGLASVLEAVGRSNGTPVLNADGSVNMAASRRVSFRFILNI